MKSTKGPTSSIGPEDHGWEKLRPNTMFNEMPKRTVSEPVFMNMYTRKGFSDPKPPTNPATGTTSAIAPAATPSAVLQSAILYYM